MQCISNDFKNRCPVFPDSQIFTEDFFEHKGKYDLIIEQTFFSSLQMSQRAAYAHKIVDLLKENGKLAGLLFDIYFPFHGPPYGGSYAEYKLFFEKAFNFVHFEKSKNSIKPRRGNELFILLQKKEL